MNTFSGKPALLAGLLILGAAASAQNDIRVTVDGQEVMFPGIGPKYMNGRVLVPVRGVFEHMGATVRWNPASRTVTADDGEKQIRLVINSKTAWVNGERQMIDVPARIISGSTVVPLRFLSEALGASVEWNSTQRLVSIISASGSGSVDNRAGLKLPPYITIASGTVIPVQLDEQLSSNVSRAGDIFTATIRQEDTANYAGLPWGTKVEGKVVTAKPKNGKNPGVLELDFTRFRLPNGATYPINGSLIALDSNSVETRADGVLVVRPEKKDDRLIYAGAGAAGGLIVGILTKKPLEGTILGGILGYLYGENKRKTDTSMDNVLLRPGTEFGVRLDSDARIRETVK